MCIRNVAIVSYLVNFCFVLPHMDVIQLVGYVTSGACGREGVYPMLFTGESKGGGLTPPASDHSIVSCQLFVHNMKGSSDDWK